MRLVTYQHAPSTTASGTSAGVLLGDALADINDLLTLDQSDTARPRFCSLDDLLSSGGVLEDLTNALRKLRHRHQDGRKDLLRLSRICRPVSTVQLLPPVLRPSKVIGVGMNYRSFLDQLGEPTPAHPVLFHKTASALTGHGQPIVIPPITDQAVPEGELAVVIGRRADAVSVAQAEAHVAGYTCANDISARNLEFRTSQWTSGKMLRTFCPLGPALVTPDEIKDVHAVAVKTMLNGRQIQHGHTDGMIFSVSQLVSAISHLVLLEPADVILTGTPSDLGAVEPPVYLTAGDTIQVQIAGIGTLENPVRTAHLSDTTPPAATPATDSGLDHAAQH